MGEGVSDRALLDIRGIDLPSLVTQPGESDIRTALDRLLASPQESYNGFNNYI
jgi:hypothetical protein